MTAGPWMPMYWADYFGDTMHLSTEEHGAYLLLIGAYWRRAKRLPDDDRFLASCAKMSTKKWKMVRPIILEFFDILDGHLTHKRIENEILKSSERYNSARANGRAGGLAKAKLTTTTVTTIKKKEREPNGSSSAEADPILSAVKIYEEETASLKWPHIRKLTAGRRSSMAKRLEECGGLDGWRAAMKRGVASDFLSGRTERSNGHANWIPDLDFFLQQKSFLHLIEGKFDNKTGINGTGHATEETWAQKCVRLGIDGESNVHN